jgi:hypothetical protein
VTLDAFQIMTSNESALSGLLQRMVEDIKDLECSYWLYSNYFDIQPPTERRMTRWWAPLFIDYDALGNPAFEDSALLIDVILKNNCRPRINASALSMPKSGR